MRLLSSIVQFFRVGFDEFLSHAPYPILSDIAIHSSIRRLYKRRLTDFVLVAFVTLWHVIWVGLSRHPDVSWFREYMDGSDFDVSHRRPVSYHACTASYSLSPHAAPSFPLLYQRTLFGSLDFLCHTYLSFDMTRLSLTHPFLFHFSKDKVKKKRSPLSINWAWFLGL